MRRGYKFSVIAGALFALSATILVLVYLGKPRALIIMGNEELTMTLSAMLKVLMFTLLAAIVHAGFFDHVADHLFFGHDHRLHHHYSGYYPDYYRLPYPTYGPTPMGQPYYYQGVVSPAYSPYSPFYGKRK